MNSATRWRTGLALVAVAAGFATFLLLSTLFPRADNHPVPTPDITGAYSTRGLSGIGCLHTGPVWVTALSLEGADGSPSARKEIFRVKDVYYCAITTGGAVIPVKGDRYDLYVPFTFSKKEPKS